MSSAALKMGHIWIMGWVNISHRWVSHRSHMNQKMVAYGSQNRLQMGHR